MCVYRVPPICIGLFLDKHADRGVVVLNRLIRWYTKHPTLPFFRRERECLFTINIYLIIILISNFGNLVVVVGE